MLRRCLAIVFEDPIAYDVDVRLQYAQRPDHWYPTTTWAHTRDKAVRDAIRWACREAEPGWDGLTVAVKTRPELDEAIR